MTASANRKEVTALSKKQIHCSETVPLKLTGTERKVVLEDLTCLDEAYEKLIQGTAAGKPVKMRLSDLEDFGGYVAAEANHCHDKRKQKRLDGVFEKIQHLLDTYTDEDDGTMGINQARCRTATSMANVLAGEDTGVVSFQSPRTQKQLGEKFPIKVTALQREALVSHTRIKAAIKRELEEAGEGTQVIEFTSQELDHIENELILASVYAPSPYKQRVIAVKKKVHDTLEETRLVEFGITEPGKRRPPATASELLFQFKIVLLDISPSVWRRIQVRNCSLADLHDQIQAAFGWWNDHMHQFEIDGQSYGRSSRDDFGFGRETIDEAGVLLSQMLPRTAKRANWIYEYDFGDGWRHEIIFEGNPPIDKKSKYPLCVEGECACPPEDVGGPWGYAEYLEAISDSDHERHEELMEWHGPFDPNEFDAKKVTREMRKH